MATCLPPPPGLNYTVFSKAGCGDCDKAKSLLEAKGVPFTVVPCDAWLVEEGGTRDKFLTHARILMDSANAPVRFPMIFHNRVYVGGYAALKRYLEDVEDW